MYHSLPTAVQGCLFLCAVSLESFGTRDLACWKAGWSFADPLSVSGCRGAIMGPTGTVGYGSKIFVKSCSAAGLAGLRWPCERGT